MFKRNFNWINPDAGPAPLALTPAIWICAVLRQERPSVLGGGKATLVAREPERMEAAEVAVMGLSDEAETASFLWAYTP